MNKMIVMALLLTVSGPALAQNVQGQTSESTSGSVANSGSLSGAQSNNTANNNAGIGSSQNENTSTSNSGAVSGSASESNSNSNGNIQGQDQGQAQSANNTQGQNQSASSDQGQSQGQMQDQNQALDSSQANSQGVTINQTYNTKNRRETEVRTNNAVPLASSSSFSSDYCGGSVSAGGSSAPLGISIGMAAPKFDKSCQSLRRAEKFGMAAVNAMNMGQPELGGRLMSMMIWSICTSDSAGPSVDRTTADACDKLLLLGSIRSADSRTPAPAAAPEPRIARNGKITPEAATRALAQNDQKAAASVSK